MNRLIFGFQRRPGARSGRRSRAADAWSRRPWRFLLWRSLSANVWRCRGTALRFCVSAGAGTSTLTRLPPSGWSSTVRSKASGWDLGTRPQPGCGMWACEVDSYGRVAGGSVVEFAPVFEPGRSRIFPRLPAVSPAPTPAQRESRPSPRTGTVRHMSTLLRRLAVSCALISVLAATPSNAEATVPGPDDRPWMWPLEPVSAVVESFDPPQELWSAGHRGIDVAGRIGQPVQAVAAGIVAYAGVIAGRGVVVVSHGELRSTYEPVTAVVSRGDAVTAGQPIGLLQIVQSHCLPAACLHLEAPAAVRLHRSRAAPGFPGDPPRTYRARSCCVARAFDLERTLGRNSGPRCWRHQRQLRPRIHPADRAIEHQRWSRLRRWLRDADRGCSRRDRRPGRSRTRSTGTRSLSSTAPAWRPGTATCTPTECSSESATGFELGRSSAPSARTVGRPVAALHFTVARQGQPVDPLGFAP